MNKEIVALRKAFEAKRIELDKAIAHLDAIDGLVNESLVGSIPNKLDVRALTNKQAVVHVLTMNTPRALRVKEIAAELEKLDKGKNITTISEVLRRLTVDHIVVRFGSRWHYTYRMRLARPYKGKAAKKMH
jgi:putative CRISPR-associated protein (TIGR02620 family)